MAETICHFEFVSDDPQRSRAFYTQVFTSWKFNDQGMPGYTMINTGGDPGGGLFARPKEVPGPGLNVYILVESIVATLDRARQAGGQVICGKTELPGMGWWAMFTDLDGIAVGLFEPIKK
jgi:uncharacterized protein